MMTETTPSIPTPFTATDKARLITDALDSLRGADAIDERETLDAETWVAWYDATLPQVRDIKILAGAMDIELAKRRGAQVVAEGERRGGDQSKVTHRVTLSQIDRNRRSQDLALYEEAALVDTYVTREAAAGGVPSRRGALQAVKAVKQATPRRRPDSPAPSWKAAQFSGAQLKAQQRADGILTALTAVADGTHYSDAALRRAIRHHATVEVQEFLKCIRLIPWLSIARDDRGTTFKIDNELRAICEGLAPRTTLPDGLSIAAFLHGLRSEITRRRKENHEGYRKRNWTTESSKKADMHDLLNWIEDELQKVDDVLGS